MAVFDRWNGVLPAAGVVYKDKSCKEIDEAAYREHLRDMLQADIAALVVASGHESLSIDEKVRVVEIAREEAKGKVPVVGGVISDSTWEAIEYGKRHKAAGADAILLLPPTIVGWDPNTADELLVEHVRRFDKEVDMPFIFNGSPVAEGFLQILPKTFKKLALETKNLVAWKINSRYHLGAFRSSLSALREAEKETGRHVAALLAGDMDLVEALMNGGDGNLNGGGIYRVREDVEIYKAVKGGDVAKAFAIQSRMQPLTDAIRGTLYGKSFTYFPYRYKVAAWLLGKITRPYMRLPYLPISREEVEIIRDALIKVGMTPVRDVQEFEVAGM